MKASKISVVVPVYNTATYLQRCLDSIINQTFDAFEIICVNDGSTDNSLSVLEKYAQDDARIRIVTQENQGLSGARNTGLQYTQGEYVCFVDSDDWIDKEYLNEMYSAAIESNAEVVMVRTRHYLLDGSIISREPESTAEVITFCEKIESLPHGGACNKLYKTTLLREHDLTFPCGLLWEDNIFTLKVCFYCNKIKLIPSVYYNYIENTAGITRNEAKMQKLKSDSLVMAKMMLDFLKEQKCGITEQMAVSDFCMKCFVLNSYLQDYSYRKKLFSLILKTPLVKRLAWRQIRKSIKQKLRFWE